MATPAENYRKVVDIIRTGRNIDAIKFARETFSLDLKEAKELVEAITESIVQGVSKH